MPHEVTVTIDSAHPALEGHFPENPIVPAVVILGEVFKAFQDTTSASIQVVEVPHAKFVSPLKPGEPLTIYFESQKADETQFTCLVGETLISTGSLRFTIFEQELEDSE